MKKISLLILILVLIVIQSCQSDSSIIEEEQINFESITQETLFINGTQYTIDIGKTNGKSKILNPEIAQMIDEFRAAPEGNIYINAKQEVHLYSEPEDYERFILEVDAIVAQNAIDITPIDDGCCSSGACPCSGGGDGPGDPIGDGGIGGGGSGNGGTGGGGSQDFSPDRLCDGNSGPCISLFNNRFFNEPEPDAGEINLLLNGNFPVPTIFVNDLENLIDFTSGNNFDDKISSVYIRSARVRFFQRADFGGKALTLDARNANGATPIIVFDDIGDIRLTTQTITVFDILNNDYDKDNFFTRSFDNKFSSLQVF